MQQRVPRLLPVPARLLVAAAAVLVALSIAPAADGAVASRFADCRTGYGGASVGVSGSLERLYIDRTVPACRVKVGGYSASTHFARLRWTDVDLRLSNELWLFGSFYLPSAFYSKQESYLRLAWLENYNLDPVNTRRLGLVLYGGDKLPRLVRTRSGREETTIWTGSSTLPTGRWSRLELRFVLSQKDGEALSEVYVDGTLIGSTTLANVTSGDTTTARFTRVGFGIDGAANQSTKTLELAMRDIGLSPTRRP